MTDAEREALVERMAVAFVGLQWIGAPEALRAAWRKDALAALSAAEPVVRADERELCCKALVAMSDVEPHPARSAALVAGASTIRLVAAHHGRARGAAAGEATP